jgi:phospholipid/cholesterol/gamma-HCH transport system ATP-binding protein
MPPAATPTIQLNNVHKAFGPKKVLQGVNLSVERGTTRVILGGSGTGKSVLLKCILGLVKIDSGSMLIDGQDVTNLKDAEQRALMRKFGMLFQGGALFDSLSVWENVAFVPLQSGMKIPQAKDLAVEKLAAVGLPASVASQFPAELSGGMRKRVALARAVAHNPEIIFYDEPTTGLDPITADVINNLMLHMQKTLKCTSVVITHDMPSAFKVADTLSFLYQGKVLAEGTPKEFKNSSNAYVQQFVSGSAEGPIKTVV